MMQPESKRIHTLNIEHQQSGNYKVTIQKRRRITKKEANSMKIKKKKSNQAKETQSHVRKRM